LTIRVLQIGETEWTKSGQFTGTTEIELTQAGAEQVSSAATTLVGAGKLLDPYRLVHVFVSPRVRARNTFKLLLDPSSGLVAEKVTYTEDIAEWDYGDYEGLTDEQTRILRKEKGLDLERRWNIWSDGCEGGEYVVPWSLLLVGCC
jgi:probable phosphoglycerate mutase